MNTEDIKTIAMFMGVIPEKATFGNDWYDGEALHKAGLPFARGAMGNGTDTPPFDKSWEWRMPVVEKIESLGYNVVIANNLCSVDSNDGRPFKYIEKVMDTKSEAVNTAIVEFIKWYNNDNT